ncbi:autotransporter domain-containing protein [Rhodobacterales bacterium HKCCE2091]|nr:autotransporter domain-containing protein [Rhodobacterales bacterium HKCCE2091]
MKRAVSVAALVAGLGAGLPAAAQSISTFADENNSVCCAGPNQAFGQSFRLNAPSSLNSLRFRLDDRGSAMDYEIAVMAWDPVSHVATGAPLFTGTGTTAGASGYTDLTTTLPGTALPAGDYIAIFQGTSGVDTLFFAGVQNPTTDIYPDGEFAYQYNAGDTGSWTTVPWNTFASWTNYELVFELLFGVSAPTPAIADAAAASLQASRLVVVDTRGIIRGQANRSFATRDAMLSFVRTESGSAPFVSVSSSGMPGMMGNLYTWVEVTGFHASDDAADRSYRGAGLQIGADAEVAPGVIAGLSIGAQDISSSVGAVSQDGTLVFLQPYVGYRNGPISGEATLVYGRGDFDQDGGAGEGETELYALTLSGGYDFAFAGATITPSIGLAIGREEVEGTGGVLAGTGETVEFGELSLGARYTRGFAGGSYFAGIYADYLHTDADTALVSDLLVDDGWTGRIELGGTMELDGGISLDTAVEFGGLGGDLHQVSGALRATFRF